MSVLFIEIICGIVFMILYYTISIIVTLKQLRQNHQEWDSYSAGMTLKQKLSVYNEFCEQQKLKYGWKFYYFPRI